MLVDGRDRFGKIEAFARTVDLARYEAAKTSGDSRSILDLIHLSSLAPFDRLCRYYDLEARKPSAIWNPPKIGFFAKLLGG